jgi:hypothetical protein
MIAPGSTTGLSINGVKTVCVESAAANMFVHVAARIAAATVAIELPPLQNTSLWICPTFSGHVIAPISPIAVGTGQVQVNDIFSKFKVYTRFATKINLLQKFVKCFFVTI